MPCTHLRYYHLRDVYFRVCCSDQKTAQAFDQLAKYKTMELTAAADIKNSSPVINLYFENHHNIERPGSDFKEIGQSLDNVMVYHKGDEVCLYDENRLATLTPRAGKATFRFLPTYSYEDLYFLTAPTLSILLAYQRRWSLHAAAASYPPYSCLFIGPSGSGKSTLTLGLLQRGWNCLSDDTVLLEKNNRLVEASSFRRDFCIDANLLSSFFPALDPQLHPSPPGTSAKRRVNPGQIKAQQETASFIPKMLVFPKIVDQPKSQLLLLEQKEALLRLIPQTIVRALRDPAVAREQLTILRQLLEQTTSYRLLAGHDLKTNPQHAHTLLTSLTLN